MEEFKNDQEEEENDDFIIKVNNLHKGILKCYEDYQGEMKHAKVMIKQVYKKIVFFLLR